MAGAIFPISECPRTQNASPSVEVFSNKNYDGTISARKKTSKKELTFSATYQFKTQAESQSIIDHYLDNAHLDFSYYDWRSGSTSTVSGCRYTGKPAETITAFGNYNISLTIKRTY